MGGRGCIIGEGGRWVGVRGCGGEGGLRGEWRRGVCQRESKGMEELVLSCLYTKWGGTCFEIVVRMVAF